MHTFPILLAAGKIKSPSGVRYLLLSRCKCVTEVTKINIKNSHANKNKYNKHGVGLQGVCRQL